MFGKNASTTNFRKIISKQRRADEKMIRRTKRPILNLWRLIRDPCRMVGCASTGDHVLGGFVVPMTLLIIAIVMSLLIFFILSFGDETNMHFVGWPLWIIATSAFLVLILGNIPSWNFHADALKQIRDGLLAKKEGDYLATGLREAISATVEKLFGNQSDFQRWDEALEGRGKETGAPAEETLREDPLAGFRDPAFRTGVRIITENAEFAKALESHRAFSKESNKTISALHEEATKIGEAANRAQRLRGLPKAERVAKNELARMEAAIQKGVDEIHARLAKLVADAETNNARAARATVNVEAADAERLSTSPDVADANVIPITGDASRAAKRRSGS